MDPQHQSQIESRNLRHEIVQLLRLGGPIAFVQLGMTAMGFVDVAFLGHYDATSLPAMSLGNTLTWSCLVFCLGIVTAVDPLLSQAVGAGDAPAVTRTLLRGALLALLLTLPAMLLLLPAAHWLEWCGQKPAVIPGAALYAQITTASFLPFLWFALLRSLLSAHSRLWPQVLTIVLGNALNALLDYAWIEGRLGFAEMGTAGAAWATVCCRWLMFVSLLLLSWRQVLPHLRGFADAAVRATALRVRPLLRLLRLGLPIGAQFALEMGVFAVTQLLVGTLDADPALRENGGPRVAGHQIAIQLASMSFMIPLGLGMAASVRVGWAIGRGDQRGARRATAAALLAGAGIMSLFMLLFLLLPGPLARLLSDRGEILAWAVVLIPIAGVFQIGDGIQVVSIGCLRGLGDVRSPMLVNLLGFWCVGLPLGCWLGLPWGRDLGVQGLWWGLVAGLFAVAAILGWMLRQRLRENVQRLSAH